MGKGIACITASAFGFALMAVFVRLCDDFGGPVNCFQKSFFRNLIALLIAAAVFWRERRLASGAYAPLPRGARPLLALRCLAGCAGIFCNFYALSLIPVGEAMALNKTAPFFTVLLSWIFLGERASLKRFLMLVLAFGGVLMVMKPGFRETGAFAALCGLGGGLGAGIAYTCLRELGLMGVDGSRIVLDFSAFSCLASLPFMAKGLDPMTPVQVLVMLGAGCGAAIGQFGITAAYKFAPPRDIAIYDYSSIVFTAIMGFVLFGQCPDMLSIAGFVAIIAAAWLSTRHADGRRLSMKSKSAGVTS